MLFTCKHEEADSSLVLHAVRFNTVVVSKDTNVLVPMIYAYVKCNVKYKWYSKCDFEKYVSKIVSYLRKRSFNSSQNNTRVHWL